MAGRARQSEPSLVGNGCCWDRADASNIDIGAEDSGQSRRMIPMGTAPSRRLPVRAAIAWLPILLFTVGCTLSLPGSSANPSAKPPTDVIHQQALDALARWAEAAKQSGGATISFVGDLTGQLGGWEPAVGDNNAPALAAGLLTAPTPLSDTRPGRNHVRWVGGDSIDVDVLSAADALDDLIKEAGDECADCRPLRVTDANLATGLVETSKGPAEAPIWVFTIDGTAVRVTRVAVDPSITVVPPPFNADHPPAGISIDQATGTPGSRKLTVSFTGFEKPGSDRCGADYSAEAVESDLAVVVIVAARTLAAERSGCPDAGKTRTAAVTLVDPLGERAVLEVRQGLPVPVRAP